MADFKNTPISDILTNYEAEKYIETLAIYSINEYSSPKWFKQHELISKLNMQAHINAMMRSDEYIMESLSSLDKIKVLIYELINAEVWKANVLPLLKDHLANLRSYKPYLSVYHEAVVLNLLEVSLFHRTAVDAAENFLVELVDYCYRKLTFLIGNPKAKQIKKIKTPEELKNRNRETDFQEQIDDIEFSLCMMSISILRFITDHIKHLPVSVVHHLLVETDVLFLLVPLIEERPWIRTNSKNEREIFDNQKWNYVSKDEYSRLPKLEAQVWIAIYNIFMDEECRKKYELNEYRKSNLLRLKKYMNEILIDQIPNLNYMLRSLEELTLMNVGSSVKSGSLIVQQMPEIRTEVMKDKNWKEIAEFQKKNYFKEDETSLKEDIDRMASLYNYNILEGLIEGFKCAACGKEASKRCSKCKAEFYCSRDCQVGHWKDHKPSCLAKVAEFEKRSHPESQDKPSETGSKSSGLIKEVTKEPETKRKEASPEKSNTSTTNNPLNELD